MVQMVQHRSNARNGLHTAGQSCKHLFIDLIGPIFRNSSPHRPRLRTGPGNRATHEQIGDLRQLKRQASFGQIITDKAQC